MEPRLTTHITCPSMLSSTVAHGKGTVDVQRRPRPPFFEDVRDFCRASVPLGVQTRLSPPPPRHIRIIRPAVLG